MGARAEIVMPEIAGLHNKADYATRLKKAKTYEDLSTIIVCPSRGVMPTKVVQTWLNLMKPMNQKIYGPIFINGLEVGEAYEQAVQMILENPVLKSFKYLLTIEEDNMPQPDSLLKLYEGIGKYDVVGGLYWTKGEMGQPMIYGNPKQLPKDFVPQMPIEGTLQEANGLGMGFNLFKLAMFKDIPRPWFETKQKFTPGVGSVAYTQDLFFYEKAAKAGFRFACDTRVKIGHYDYENDIIW